MRRRGRLGRMGRRGPAALAGGLAAALLVAGLVATFDMPGDPPGPVLTAPAVGPPAGAIPGKLWREARPIGRGPRFAPSAPARVIGRCAPGLGARFAVHLELFAANRVILVPAGIGVARPWRRDEGRIAAGRCYGSFVTTDPTGVVQVARGRPASLGDLFAAWGRALSGRRLLSFPGRVRVYVDGRRRAVAPQRLALSGHAEIVLEVGPVVPPHAAYDFPPAPPSAR